MRSKNNRIICFLCVVILLFNTTVNAFAVNLSNDSNEKDVVFLTAGEDEENSGDGSQDNPYRNIKTALNNVKSGGTIKVIGTLMHWKYEEHENLLPLPLLINKEVTFEGVDSSSVFITRAPIQLGADVTFKNMKMEFWASNEVMPGVPDSGLPGEPVDEGTSFRSGRTIYLAGNKITLDNIDTRIDTNSFQRDYRPYISGGTFLDSETNIGPKAVLNVINPNEGTQFAGIYAGDYWIERNYPVELNIKGEVLDKTVHTGGITTDFNGDVVINIYSKTKVSTIDNTNHNGNYDVNVKENVTIQDATFTGVRNLTIEGESLVDIKGDGDFILENLTVHQDALLDLTKVTGNIKVTGDFIGYDNKSDDPLAGGAIFLHNDQVLDINGDVKGNTRLNSYNSINKVPLNENHIYIKAKENASGDFVIDPEYSQYDYKLEKNTNNSKRTTWTAIREKEIFKDFKWSESSYDTILNPEVNKEYLYPIEYINEKNEVYIPFGEDWDDFVATLEKPDGTILDSNNNSWDMDLGIYLYEDGLIMDIYNTSFTGEVILTVKHTTGKSITKKIQIGQQIGEVENKVPPVIHGAKDITIKVGEVDKFNSDLLNGITVTDDKDRIDPSSIKVTGQVGKPSAGNNDLYTITYEVSDNNGNIGKASRVITVTNQLPIIEGLNDITIKRGESVDLKVGVTAKDNEDGNLTEKVVLPNVDLGNLNIGQHEIKYTVVDSDNNSVTQVRRVNVEANTVTKVDIIGTDRYETASKISNEGWSSANTVILVNGLDKHLIDGLTATPLASALDAPILLTRNNSLPKTTIDEIRRLNASKIIVIGGTVAISESVISELRSISRNMSVQRISGQNRYETSLNIAKELDKIAPINKIYVGAGNGEADSLSISSVAGREKSPIILTAKDSVDNNTYNYLKSKNLSDAYFIGGNAIISDKVIEQVDNIVSKNISGNRIAGSNRRETNAKVIEKFYPEANLSGVVIAKDLNLVDALSVGPLAAKRNQPVVLAQNSLSEGQENVLRNKFSSKLYQAGGGVSNSVLDSLKKLLTM